MDAVAKSDRFRIDLDISELADEIVSHHPESLFHSSETKFLDPAYAGGQFLYAVAKRLLKNGHSQENILGRLYGVEYRPIYANSYKIRGLLGAHLQIISTLDQAKEVFHNMKFDVVLGNPPYQDKEGNENSTNSGDLYKKFIEKSLDLTKDDGYVAMVVPSAWSGPRSGKLKEMLFEENQPTVFDSHGKKWFDVNMNTCYFVTQKGRKGPTEVRDAHGLSITKTLTKEDIIGTDLKSQIIKEKLKDYASKGNLGDLWTRGKLHLNQAKAFKGNNKVEFIKAVGSKNSTECDTMYINQTQEAHGLGLHKVVLPNLGGSDVIGNIKVVDKNTVGGHSVVFLPTKNNTQSKNLKAYLESKLVRYLISSIKISTPNSKNVFKNIPVVDLDRTWTDPELYKYFKLTKNDIGMIDEYFG
jgi:site-specific DNA-methyltransferase (adenine-specific)